MKELGEYLTKHNGEEFWKEVLSSSVASVTARN